MSRVATPTSLFLPIIAKAPVSIIGAEALLAAQVVDRDSKRIGGLGDLMVDLRQGRVAYGLVALDDAPACSGGLIDAMHADGDGNLKVNARRDWVERGPSVPAGLMANLLDHEWAVFIHSYFGARPYWERNAQHG
jgi:hypothetical protein